MHDLRGARGHIVDSEDVLRRLASWGAERKVEILVADARAVFGRDHLESAVLHAERAQRQGAMSTRSLPMETLLYLSGRRQVADAIAAAGVRPGTQQIAVAVFGNTLAAEVIEAMRWTADPRVLDATRKDAAVLGLTPTEIATIPRARWPDLALERVALLDVEK